MLRPQVWAFLDPFLPSSCPLISSSVSRRLLLSSRVYNEPAQYKMSGAKKGLGDPEYKIARARPQSLNITETETGVTAGNH
jgi:hypothetical protein